MLGIVGGKEERSGAKAPTSPRMGNTDQQEAAYARGGLERVSRPGKTNLDVDIQHPPEGRGAELQVALRFQQPEGEVLGRADAVR